MPKKAISTEAAPAAIGPYSQAIVAGGFVFCSGQVAIDASTGEMIDGGVAEQTTKALDNLGAVLTAAGATFDDVVKTTIFLTDLGDYATVNAIYGERFGAVAPARAAVEVSALPKGARVEIEAVARLETQP